MAGMGSLSPSSSPASFMLRASLATSASMSRAVRSVRRGSSSTKGFAMMRVSLLRVSWPGSAAIITSPSVHR